MADTFIEPSASQATGKRPYDDSDASGEETTKRACTSEKMDADNAALKPQPEVHAYRRQALCEALPYYNSYKASLYTYHGVAYGCLIDGGARAMDVFSAQVIITTVGGGRVKDSSGGMTTTKDLEESNDSKAITQAKENGAIIPVIAGKQHPLWPCKKPDYEYSVLDYFQVTDVWAEKNEKGHRLFCFRMEKANLTTTSWWDHRPASYVRAVSPPEMASCIACKEESKRIYTESWTCLNHKCERFFQGQGGQILVSPTYSEYFLQERTEFTGDIPSVKPPIPSPEELNGTALHGSETIFRKGIVCPKCGCCSSRKYWNRWTCENIEREKCTFKMVTRMDPYPLDILEKEVAVFNEKIARCQTNIDSEVLVKKLNMAMVKHREVTKGPYEVSQFLLPNPRTGKIIGSVTVFRASKAICAAGPNEMFDDLSTTDIGLCRNIVSGGESRQSGWSRHFQQNWGAKYKFGVDVQSKGFDEAPDSVLKAVYRLKWAGRTAVPMAAQFITALGLCGSNIHQANIDFNECLSLGYMENDKIHYHDDGEKQLGPTVATLSLGSPAMMAFRPKRKLNMGTLYKNECLRKKGGDFPDVLAFPLYHGDLLVMHGTKIHEFYEHAVDPSGNRRFALTCRYIDPLKMKKKHRVEALIKGKMPPGSEQFEYTGDGDLPPAPEKVPLSNTNNVSTTAGMTVSTQATHGYNLRGRRRMTVTAQ